MKFTASVTFTDGVSDLIRLEGADLSVCLELLPVIIENEYGKSDEDHDAYEINHVFPGFVHEVDPDEVRRTIEGLSEGG